MDKKTTNLIIIGAALVVAGYFIFKSMKPKGSEADDDATEGTDDGTDDGTEGTDDGTNSDISINAKMLANQLFDAMDGYGTNEDDILLVFKEIKSNADFDALNLAFGTKTISSGAGNIFVSDFTGNLKACLKSELSSDYIAQINQILASNGVTKKI